ncbi:nickel/cobalt transporter [Photobacterium rosenbergii]|uniref:Nickel/cobalt efflux system n=1 Tax=Photobacterium rosenbergii TaxID=294936 RepID=A0ABU3ZGK4_9GAMM|nr:nickel/cobalt transporter [Photobacterium rosenbergii]MDV5169245.1 nickel/cobalt transporter [Photobacterium rosenbergii]
MLSVLAIALLFGAYQLWLAWPSMVLKSIEWQRAVNNQLADLLYDAKENPLVSGGYLAGFSFLYGTLHALGPGHGKVIVTTYLATQPTKVKTSLMLTLVSAICQALVAVALVSVLLWGFNASMREVSSQAVKFMTMSSALVSVLGVMICWRAIKRFRQSVAKQEKTACSYHHDHHHHHHDHGTECGCGHRHMASPEEVDNAKTLREYVGVIMSIGLRPCTGAIMVLLFANMVGLYWMGVVSALVMSLGTALTTSALALLTLSGKCIVHRYLQQGNGQSGESESNTGLLWAGYSLQLFGGVLLILLGLLLASSQSTGLSPVLLG